MPAFVLLAVLAGPALAQDGRTYQQPPAPIATSIFALQRFGDRYYVGRAAGAAGARKEKAAV